jgi:hypothetical protein
MLAANAPNTTVVLACEDGREAAHSSNPKTLGDSEEAIRALAHSKWEAAGCPAGDGAEFWLEAERELSLITR